MRDDGPRTGLLERGPRELGTESQYEGESETRPAEKQRGAEGRIASPVPALACRHGGHWVGYASLASAGEIPECRRMSVGKRERGAVQNR